MYQLQEVDHRPDQEAVAAGRQGTLSPLWPERMVNMNPLDVQCPRCLAKPGESCTTLYSKRAVLPHTPRAQLARAGVACRTCGAGRLEPCVYDNGRVRLFLHRARQREAAKAAGASR